MGNYTTKMQLPEKRKKQKGNTENLPKHSTKQNAVTRPEKVLENIREMKEGNVKQ